MEVLIVLMVASLIIASIFLIAFIFSVKGDQYEDTHTPAMRVIMEDINKEIEKENKNLKN